jgi:hypothetical protein
LSVYNANFPVQNLLLLLLLLLLWVIAGRHV